MPTGLFSRGKTTSKPKQKLQVLIACSFCLICIIHISTICKITYYIIWEAKEKLNDILYSMLGVLIPFIGTILGSILVFFLRKDINEKFQKIIIGFASGVMIAASIWSLVMPSVEMAEEQGLINWLPATTGLVIGIIFLILTSKVADKIAKKKNGKKLNMLFFSVTLHNIPEGMAVRSMLCWFFSRKYRNNINCCNGIGNWNCYSKHTRGSYNFNAFKNEGNE